MSSSCEQVTFYNLSWRTEDRCGLAESTDAVDSLRFSGDMVVIDRKTHAFVSSLGIEVVKVTSHGFAQAAWVS